MAQLERQYVTIPKDLTVIKQKFLLGLTKRQFLCYGGAALVGVPILFLTKGNLLGFIFVFILAAPLVACAHELNGMYMDKVARIIINFYKKPRIRTYQSENLYLQIEKEIEYCALNKKLQTIERSRHGSQISKKQAIQRRNKNN